MDCSVAREQFSAYLLGTLDAAEMETVDLHVDLCDPCRQDLREEGETLVGLAHLAPQMETPARIKRRLISAIEAETVEAGTLADVWNRLRAGPRLRLNGHLGIVLTSVAILVLALGGVWANGHLNEIAEAKNAMARQSEVLASPGSVPQDALLLAFSEAAPELVVEELSATSRAADARGMFLVPKSDHSAVLVGLGLARLPRHFEYRVWLILDGRRYEGGSFGVNSAGFGYTAIEFFAPLAQLDGIGVTIERRRGSGDPASAITTEVQRGDL